MDFGDGKEIIVKDYLNKILNQNSLSYWRNENDKY